MGANPETSKFDDQWHSFKLGDMAAFASIYRQYSKDLLSYGYRVTADRSLIEDSIQDLFLDLWNSKDRLSETNSIKFYLFKALRYKITHNKNGNSVVQFCDNDQVPDSLSHLSHESFLIMIEAQSDQMRHLKDEIAQLPQRQQEAINLRYYNNFTNEQVAEIMGVHYQSACRFIYLALQKLKSNLRISVS